MKSTMEIGSSEGWLCLYSLPVKLLILLIGKENGKILRVAYFILPQKKAVAAVHYLMVQQSKENCEVFMTKLNMEGYLRTARVLWAKKENDEST